MESSEPQASGLDEILGRLRAATSERLAEVLYRGIVVGRTDDTLSLASEIGLVDIPLTEIEHVEPDPSREDLVDVVVRNGGAVREVLRVEPLTGFPPDRLPGLVPQRSGYWKDLLERLGPRGVWTWCDDCADTVTNSGTPPEQDATDDYVCSRYPCDSGAGSPL